MPAILPLMTYQKIDSEIKQYPNNQGHVDMETQKRMYGLTAISTKIFMSSHFMDRYISKFTNMLFREMKANKLAGHAIVKVKNSSLTDHALSLDATVLNSSQALKYQHLLKDTIYITMANMQEYLHECWFSDEPDLDFIQKYSSSVKEEWPEICLPFEAPRRCARKSNQMIDVLMERKVSLDMPVFPTRYLKPPRLLFSPVFCTSNKVDNSSKFEIVRLRLNHTTCNYNYRNFSSILFSVRILEIGDPERDQLLRTGG